MSSSTAIAAAVAPPASIPAEFLFTLSLDIAWAHDIGATPLGHKRFAGIAGGRFEGTRLRGVVCAGGSDWIQVRPDDIRQVDVRILLQTHDGALIAMRYEGYRLPAAQTETGLAGHSEHAYRVAALFECADARYAWLNGTLAVGLGTRVPPAGPVYEVFSVR